MKKKTLKTLLSVPVLVIFMLWMIAITVAMLALDGTDYFSQLFPVFLLCMIGSIITVRKLVEKKFIER